jgi:hypothetical protein
VVVDRSGWDTLTPIVGKPEEEFFVIRFTVLRKSLDFPVRIVARR